MRRVPILATIIVLAAAGCMIALGIWQLERAEWKRQILADYARAATMPAVDLDPLLAREPAELPPLAFRRALVTCRAHNVRPELRSGHDSLGTGGYSYFVPCLPGAPGLGGRILVNAGWTAMPDNRLRLSLDGVVAGTLGAFQDGRPLTLTSATARPPLQPSTPPSAADIPNNHIAYAFQWFFFAAAALVIYALALRGRRAPKLPPEP